MENIFVKQVKDGWAVFSYNVQVSNPLKEKDAFLLAKEMRLQLMTAA